jgi:hypothetical protein
MLASFAPPRRELRDAEVQVCLAPGWLRAISCPDSL